MSKLSDVWVISTLAMYQTRFWVDVAVELKDCGQEVVFISFDDRSSEYLAEHGFCVYTINNADYLRADELLLDVKASLSEYGIENLNYWLTHERLAFDLRDSFAMTRRLMAYIAFAERCVRDILMTRRPVVIQELGGFISVIACYFVSRKHEVDHWFIEPSFYRGRQFFLKNRFSAIRIPDSPMSAVHGQVKAYLKQAQEHKEIVIPLKDKRHYLPAIKKILNFYNIRRLAQKAIDKYILKKHQEFGHLRSHVIRHMKMLFNSFMLKGSYTSLGELNRFVYYPLHVPGDMALTLRSPEFLNQLALIDYLARNLPYGYKLAVKEHPAMIGAMDAGSLKKLLMQYDNLVLINPSVNNYDVINECEAIISVNSKSGAEGVMLGKRVLVLGDAFYRNCPLVTPINKLTDIPKMLMSKLVVPQSMCIEQIENYFNNVWDCSYPGELYFCGQENAKLFSRSMVDALGGE